MFCSAGCALGNTAGMFDGLIKYLRHGRPVSGLIGRDNALNEDQIRLCYEVVLGRTADEDGLLHYLLVAKAQNLNTLHLLARELYRSDEFQSRFCAGQSDVFAKTKEIEYCGLRLELPEDDAIFREIAAFGAYEPYVSQHLILARPARRRVCRCGRQPWRSKFAGSKFSRNRRKGACVRSLTA